MDKNNFCVIMAGGIGSRFWPLSTSDCPKQFIDILGKGSTLIQDTFNRMNKICPAENIYVVTNMEYISIVAEQLPKVPKNNILGEPIRRNTAPCIAYASYKIDKINKNANIVVCPSDHIIQNEDEYIKIINKSLNFTQNNDVLLTLGIEPTRPETGYGYIQSGSQKEGKETIELSKNFFKVKNFTEKPNLELAKKFIDSGDFYWNSGIFVWNVRSIIKAFEIHQNDLSNIFSELQVFMNTSNEYEKLQKAYAESKSISIDYGIMEHAQNVYVLKCDFGWSDLGTWGSLYEISEKDNNKNVIIGENAKCYNSKSCIVSTKGDKILVVNGLDDIIVVNSKNVILICKREDEQQIKNIVNDLQ